MDKRNKGRRLRRIVLALVVLPILAVLAVACAFAAPGYRGVTPVAPFDGTRFVNPGDVPEHGFRDFMKWSFSRERGPWEPEEALGAVTREPPVERVHEGLRVTHVNHSTVLLQLEGLNILTDPIWSERCSPVSWAGPKRAAPAGLRFEDLPPIDVVLISHNHYDHLDLPTLGRLSERDRPRVLAGLGNKALLDASGVQGASDLDWWQEVELAEGLRAVFVPAQHFSGRGLGDRNRTLWGGFVLVSEGARVFFAGDTGYGPHFEEIRARFGAPDLAILPVGAFRPRWFMSPVHMDPAQAVQVHREMGARVSLGGHYGTFPLADDGQEEPLALLDEALAAQGVPAERFWILPFGEARVLPAAPAAGAELVHNP